MASPDYEELDDKALLDTKSWLKIVEIAKETLLIHGETLEKPDMRYI
jgi:hypothetical protein